MKILCTLLLLTFFIVACSPDKIDRNPSSSSDYKYQRSTLFDEAKNDADYCYYSILGLYDKFLQGDTLYNMYDGVESKVGAGREVDSLIYRYYLDRKVQTPPTASDKDAYMIFLKYKVLPFLFTELLKPLYNTLKAETDLTSLDRPFFSIDGKLRGVLKISIIFPGDYCINFSFRLSWTDKYYDITSTMTWIG